MKLMHVISKHEESSQNVRDLDRCNTDVFNHDQVRVVTTTTSIALENFIQHSLTNFNKYFHTKDFVPSNTFLFYEFLKLTLTLSAFSYYGPFRFFKALNGLATSLEILHRM